MLTMKSILRWALVLVGLMVVYSLALAGVGYTSLKLYVGQKNWPRALMNGPKALEEDPEKPDVYRQYGIALAESDSLARAGQVLAKGLEIAKAQNDADQLKELTTTRDYYYIKRFNAAAVQLQNGLEVEDSLGKQPDTSKVEVRAVLAQTTQKFRQCLEMADEAILLKADDEKCWSLRGNALGKLGRHAEAVQAYRKALEVKPDYQLAKDNLFASLTNSVVTYMRAQDWESAVVTAEQLVAMGDTNSLVTIGDCYTNKAIGTPKGAQRDSMFLKAVTYYQKYLANNPKDTTVIGYCISSMTQGHDSTSAIAMAKGLVAAEPYEPFGYMRLAEAASGNSSLANGALSTFAVLVKGQQVLKPELKPAPKSQAAGILARLGPPDRVYTHSIDKYKILCLFYPKKGEIHGFVQDQEFFKILFTPI
ncbi:MAG: tetratricopeptide repeat protein [Candidatus Eisenbacteria bacterium]|nr:tetratricopeptide repeat protein [Candidatus Eisenbacteria bacterium]